MVQHVAVPENPTWILQQAASGSRGSLHVNGGDDVGSWKSRGSALPTIQAELFRTDELPGALRSLAIVLEASRINSTGHMSLQSKAFPLSGYPQRC